MHVRRDLVVFALVFMLSPALSFSQLAKGKSKFLGNALTSGLLWPNYTTYWNQVTPGNAGKWGSVEGVQDSYNWAPLDDIYNLALSNGFPFKEHCLVWGQQQPSWVTLVDSATQRAQVEEWIRLVGERYGSAYFVDVVNEPFHAVPSYANALGGTGATGWDWVITAFQWARQYCLKGVKLLLNEYNILQDNTATTNYLTLIDTLRVRGLIDGIGIQGHYFEFKGSGYTYSINTLKANLQRLTATGLPVYISEFDINEPVDSVQLANYKVYFPLFWEEPGVKGMTLWGYMQGDMWKVDAYLVRQNGTERPALQWLRKYVNIPFPPVLISPSGTTGEPRNPVLKWHSSPSALSYHVQVTPNAVYGGDMPVDTTVADTVLQLSPLDANIAYYWHVSAINDSGASSYSVTSNFTTGDQILDVEETVPAPQEFVLFQNYPNPFNPSSVIRYTIGGVGSIPSSSSTGRDSRYASGGTEGQGSGASIVKLIMYDLLGREVGVLVNERKTPGTYQITFDGSGLPSGTYFYRLVVGSYSDTKKMVLMK